MDEIVAVREQTAASHACTRDALPPCGPAVPSAFPQLATCPDNGDSKVACTSLRPRRPLSFLSQSSLALHLLSGNRCRRAMVFRIWSKSATPNRDRDRSNYTGCHTYRDKARASPCLQCPRMSLHPEPSVCERSKAHLGKSCAATPLWHAQLPLLATLDSSCPAHMCLSCWNHRLVLYDVQSMEESLPRRCDSNTAKCNEAGPTTLGDV